MDSVFDQQTGLTAQTRPAEPCVQNHNMHAPRERCQDPKCTKSSAKPPTKKLKDKAGLAEDADIESQSNHPPKNTIHSILGQFFQRNHSYVRRV